MCFNYFWKFAYVRYLENSVLWLRFSDLQYRLLHPRLSECQKAMVLLQILPACSNAVIGYNFRQLCKVTLIEEIFRFSSPAPFLFLNLEIGGSSACAGLPCFTFKMLVAICSEFKQIRRKGDRKNKNHCCCTAGL